MVPEEPRRSVAALLWQDESAQDLLEYALLSAFVGLAGAAVFGLLANALGSAYGGWDAGVQGIWEPPAPSGS